jgi:hypothetical protein
MAELPGARTPVWFFGASRLGNQTFDWQIFHDNQRLRLRYPVKICPSTRHSRRIAIRRLLGASRLTTSGCSRLRAQASELTHVLATDPRRFAPLQRRECGIERQLSGSEFEGREFEGI